MSYSLFLLLNSDTEPVNLGRIDFAEYKGDVNVAFAKLFTVCHKTVKFSDENFNVIRNSCITVDSPLHYVLKQTTNTDDLFEVLAENKNYCNWMNVTYLKVIATACGNDSLLSLIKNYTDVIYSTELGEILDHIPYSVRYKYYSEIRQCGNYEKHPEYVTLGEVIEYKPQLANSIVMGIGGRLSSYLREGNTYVYVCLYVCIII